MDPSNADDIAGVLPSLGLSSDTATQDTASQPADDEQSSVGDLLKYFSAPQTPQATLPTQAPTTQSSLKAGQSVAAGSKVSQGGYSASNNAAIQAGPHTQLERGEAADLAGSQQEFKPIQEEERQAAQAARAAALQTADIEAKKAGVMAEGKQKIANANVDFQAKEQAAYDNAKAESATSIAQYRTALMNWQASAMNPSDLWDHAGASGQFAMIATAFGHDFLGAKSIQTSGLDTINAAIKNNIAAQLENMNKQGQVTNAFRQLWEMQRAQSATDDEARQRLHGFYLASVKDQVEANLSGYDSDLARAKGQAAAAAISQEQVKNDLAVQVHIDTSANQRTANRVKAYGDELQASSARYSADAHIKAAEIEANARKQPASPLAGVIFDTSVSGNNMAARRLLPDVKPETADKIREQTAKVIDTANNIERLIDLQNKIGKVMPTGNIAALNSLQNEAQRVAELVRNTTKMGIIYDNSGKQINEQEVKIYDEIVGKKDWWLNGDNVRTLGTLAKQVLDKNNAVLSAVSTEIRPGDPAYGVSSGERNIAKGETTLANIQSEEGSGRHEATFADTHAKAALAPHAHDILDDSGGGYQTPIGLVGDSHEVVDYLKKHGDGAPIDANRVDSEWTGYLRSLPTHDPDRGLKPDKAFVETAILGAEAQAGNKSAQDKLKELGENNQDPLLSRYAQWILTQK